MGPRTLLGHRGPFSGILLAPSDLRLRKFEEGGGDGDHPRDRITPRRGQADHPAHRLPDQEYPVGQVPEKRETLFHGDQPIRPLSAGEVARVGGVPREA